MGKFIFLDCGYRVYFLEEWKLFLFFFYLRLNKRFYKLFLFFFRIREYYE